MPIHSIIRPVQSIAVPSAKQHACRRVFNSDQLIERFDKWLLVCGRSENTRVTYTQAARQFAKFLVNKPLTAATKDDVRDFIGALYGRGLASTTMQARLDALRVFFDFLHLGGRTQDSVPRRILRRKLPKRLPHAKSEEVILQVINAAETPRDRAVLEMFYATGLRLSELAHLRIECSARLKPSRLRVSSSFHFSNRWTRARRQARWCSPSWAQSPSWNGR
jgi:site-specific recombinase XerD